MSNLLFVGAGGFMGAIMRHLVASAAQANVSFVGIPMGTTAVNVIGCLLFGFLGAMADAQGLLSSQARLLIFTGFLGSFTTFSTFGNETVTLAQGDQLNTAILYVILKLGLGFGGIVVGQTLGQIVGRYI